MIKRLVFDLDNTLIMWKDEYIDALKETMKEFNVNYDYNIINDIIENQERLHDRLNKETLLNDINNKCSLNLEMSFIDLLLKKQSKLVVKNDFELIDTIKYLSSKYELILLTNWFKDVQIARLKEASIDFYFKEFYGGDDGLMKPSKQAFIKACSPYKTDECLMIGDSIPYDIKGASEVGMNVILCDFKNKNIKTSYKTIKNISELKEML